MLDPTDRLICPLTTLKNKVVGEEDRILPQLIDPFRQRLFGFGMKFNGPAFDLAFAIGAAIRDSVANPASLDYVPDVQAKDDATDVQQGRFFLRAIEYDDSFAVAARTLPVIIDVLSSFTVVRYMSDSNGSCSSGCFSRTGLIIWSKASTALWTSRNGMRIL
jgi:hypothetical protein